MSLHKRVPNASRNGFEEEQRFLAPNVARKAQRDAQKGFKEVLFPEDVGGRHADTKQPGTRLHVLMTMHPGGLGPMPRLDG